MHTKVGLLLVAVSTWVDRIVEEGEIEVVIAVLKDDLEVDSTDGWISDHRLVMSALVKIPRW